MKKLLLVSLALLAVISLGSGCGGRQGKAKSAISATMNAAATLESVSTGKTPGGKPVRVYKVALQGPDAGEHLLLVVGDEKVPVTLPKASVVKIGETALLACPYLATGSGQVFAAKTSGSTILTMFEQADLGGPLLEPTSSAAPAPKGFPLDAFKAKVMSGTTIKISKLDAL